MGFNSGFKGLMMQLHIPGKCNPPVQQSGKLNNSLFSYHSAEPETEASVAA